MGGDHVEKPRHHIGIERAHLGWPVGRSDHRQTRGMMRQHHFQQLAVEPLRPMLDLAELEPRLQVEIIGAGTVLKIEIDETRR